MTDTRIQLVTRFGRVVKTTVQECTEHAEAQELRFALGMEGKRKFLPSVNRTDSRIQCTTHRGQTIETTLAEKKAYSAERNASEMELRKL